MATAYFYMLWGLNRSLELTIGSALNEGFDGIEGQVLANINADKQLKKCVSHSTCGFIEDVATTGRIIPDGLLTPEEHLTYLAAQLDLIAPLTPLFVTCLGGCDMWPADTTILFFTQAIDIAKTHNITMSFEPHRSQFIFNPWVTLPNTHDDQRSTFHSR